MSQLGTKKSRKGCRRCKERRVKCDELTPCSNCVRRSEECSLLELTPTGSADLSSSTYNPALPANNDEWINDLELMHHYSSNTSNALLSMREDAHILWSTYIPREAVKHTFLMHGLLALAALHLAYLNPDSITKYLQLCDRHQTVALKEFRTILSADSIDPGLAEALFALSAVTSVSAMARACIANEQRAVDMHTMAEIFLLARGVRDVTHLFLDRIVAGPMLRIFEEQNQPTGANVVLPPPVSQRFDALRDMLEEYGLDPEALAHCRSALRHLEEVYRRIRYFSPIIQIDKGLVMRWTTQVPTEYVRLVQAENAPALVLLAYFATALAAMRRSWYAQDFPDFALRGISLALDSSMQHWLDWPLQQTKERLAVLGANPAQGESDSPPPLIGY